MTEDDFLELLVARPDDEALREVYADWLRGQGDTIAERRARWLGFQAARRHEPTLPARTDGVRPDWLSTSLDPAWVALVGRGTVRCPSDDLAFDCPKTWESMHRIEEDDRVRFCDACQERVHFCTTVDEARSIGRSGGCVAISSTVAGAGRQALAGRRGRWTRHEPFLRQLVAELGVSERGQVGRALWHGGTFEGRAFAIQLVKLRSEWWVSPSPRVVVGLRSGLRVTLWKRRRIPHDPSFPFAGPGRSVVPGPLRAVLTEFRKDFGRIHVRPRQGAVLPEGVLAHASLVLVHRLPALPQGKQIASFRGCLGRLVRVAEVWERERT